MRILKLLRSIALPKPEVTAPEYEKQRSVSAPEFCAAIDIRQVDANQQGRGGIARNPLKPGFRQHRPDQSMCDRRSEHSAQIRRV